LVFEERTFNVGVCIKVFLISMTTSPSWGVRDNRGGVRICMKEKHNTIHGIAWEVREFRWGVRDELFLFW